MRELLQNEYIDVGIVHRCFKTCHDEMIESITYINHLRNIIGGCLFY